MSVGRQSYGRRRATELRCWLPGLRKLGAQVDEYPDGFDIHEAKGLTGGTVDASGDHRMAMAFSVAALGATGPTIINGHDVVDISYPGFFETLGELRCL